MTPTVYQNLADEINRVSSLRADRRIDADDAKDIWMKMLCHQMIDATMPPAEMRAGSVDQAHASGPLGNPLPGQIGGDLTDEQYEFVRKGIAEAKSQPLVRLMPGDYLDSVLYPSTIAYVAEFHEKFEHPIAQAPTLGTPELRALRVRMLLEEVLEFAEACAVRCAVYPVYDMNSRQWRYVDGQDNPTFTCEAYDGPLDMVEMADALGDIDYLAAGASLALGFPHCEIVEIIHSSNMSKLGEDGKPVKREDGKIMKGPNYWKPQGKIKDLLDKKIANAI